MCCTSRSPRERADDRRRVVLREARLEHDRGLVRREALLGLRGRVVEHLRLRPAGLVVRARRDRHVDHVRVAVPARSRCRGRRRPATRSCSRSPSGCRPGSCRSCCRRATRDVTMMSQFAMFARSSVRPKSPVSHAHVDPVLDVVVAHLDVAVGLVERPARLRVRVVRLRRTTSPTPPRRCRSPRRRRRRCRRSGSGTRSSSPSPPLRRCRCRSSGD